MKLLKKIHFISYALTLSFSSVCAFAWDNGGKTTRYSNPNYGTHDWIAEEASKMLQDDKRGWIDKNMVYFILGTEAPDNYAVAKRVLGKKSAKGYGDVVNHHNYYGEGDNLIDDSASRRAEQEYNKALDSLVSGDDARAAFYTGAMSHYISDTADWAHEIGIYSLFEYGESPVKHEEFEKSVGKTINAVYFSDADHTSSVFEKYVVFDGVFDPKSAYDAARIVGLKTHKGTFLSCTQMEALLVMGKRKDGSYVDCDNWSKEYIDQTGASINSAVNNIADVLNEIYIESEKRKKDLAMKNTK